MRTVDILPLKLGAVMYPEHETVKSLLIDEINSHGDTYEFQKVDAHAKGLEHFDYYSPLSSDKYNHFREWIQNHTHLTNYLSIRNLMYHNLVCLVHISLPVSVSTL